MSSCQTEFVFLSLIFFTFVKEMSTDELNGVTWKSDQRSPREPRQTPVTIHSEHLLELRIDEVIRPSYKTAPLKWPNGEVPYRFSHIPSISEGNPIIRKIFNRHYELYFKREFAKIEKNTCIKFVPYDPLVHPVDLQIRIAFHEMADACQVTIGYQPNATNRISVDPFCSLHTPHYLMHVLGFGHEINRFDANMFIWFDGKYLNSKRYPENYYAYMPYNPRSVMHAHSRYGINPEHESHSTINSFYMDQRIDWSAPPFNIKASDIEPQIKQKDNMNFSSLDFRTINLHYKCGEWHSQCIDKFSEEFCMMEGRGLREGGPNSDWHEFRNKKNFMIATVAQCIKDDFSREKCRKTCGFCHELANIPEIPDEDLTLPEGHDDY